MLAPRNPARRRWLGLLVAVLAVLGVVAGPSGAAYAHAELLSNDPAAGAVSDASPAAVTLRFSEPVEITSETIRLYDGTGGAVPVDDSVHPDGDDAVVTVALPVLPAGSYVVSWQVLSADSHPASGAFTFQVGAASTLAPDVLEQVASTRSTNDAAGALVGITRFFVITSMALIGGILASIALGFVSPGRRHRLTVQIAAVVGGIAGLIAIPFEAAYVRGLGLGTTAFDVDIWRSMLEGRVGAAWFVRALFVSFGGVVLGLTAHRYRAGWWRTSVAALLVGFGIASAYSGHGATGRWLLVGIEATVIHVVAMSVWIGGLVALLLGMDDATADGIRRYSKVAMISAIAVVVSGVIQGVRQLERASALFDTDYGRLLMAKAFGVAVILGFAAASRTAVHGRMSAWSSPPATASVGAAGTTSDVDRPTLRRAVTAEVLFAAAVLVLTTSIMGANPSEAAPTEPFSTTVVSQDYLASITVDPATSGLNQVHIYLSSPGGSLSKPDSVTVSITDPASAIAPIGLSVVPAGANHYQAVEATFPYAATWTLTIRAVYDTFDEIVFTTDVEVR